MLRTIIVIISLSGLISCAFDPDSCNSPFFDGGAVFEQHTDEHGVTKFDAISIALQAYSGGELSDVDVYINYPKTIVIKNSGNFKISDTATKGVKQASFRLADSIKRGKEKRTFVYIEPTTKIGGTVTVLIKTKFKQLIKCDAGGTLNGTDQFDGTYQKELILNENKRTPSEWILVSK